MNVHIKPATEITKEESIAAIRAASVRVERAFAGLNLMIARECERAMLEKGHAE